MVFMHREALPIIYRQLCRQWSRVLIPDAVESTNEASMLSLGSHECSLSTIYAPFEPLQNSIAKCQPTSMVGRRQSRIIKREACAC